MVSAGRSLAILKQCHKRVHVTSPLAEQSNPERMAPISKIHLVEVCALACGAGVTSEWPYTCYNCHVRVSASNLNPGPLVRAVRQLAIAWPRASARARPATCRFRYRAR